MTIYPEDLSPQEQLKLFTDAEQIVGIHGAGMAPLLYRDTNKPSLKLVEILSPGHMTNFFRVIAEHTGTSWVGCTRSNRTEAFEIGLLRKISLL